MSAKRTLFSSIRAKVQLLAGLSAAAALTVASAAFVLNDVRLFNEHKQQQLRVYAGVIGLNAMDSLAAGDVASASNVLSSLRLEPTITAACLYGSDGELLVAYRQAGEPDSAFPVPEAHPWYREWEDHEVALYQNLYDRSGHKVGSLFLRATRDDIRRQTATYTGVVAVVVAISLLAALVLARRLHVAISRPIEDLAAAANRVTERGDYSVRVGRGPNGDLGDLCDAFNAMLGRVQSADRDVQVSRDRLNERVRERTEDLRREVKERRNAEAVGTGQNRILQLLAVGEPLEGVLTTLLGQLGSGIRGGRLAIAHIDHEAGALSHVVSPGLPSGARRWLTAMPLGAEGPAPARAGVMVPFQYDHAESESGHGQSRLPEGARACWANSIRTSSGPPMGVLVVFLEENRPPTDEECELLNMAASLASVAIEQRLGEEALTEAMRKATEANRAKSEFLANMSHEIRTPLNAILGFTDLMLSEQDRLAADHREHLDTISSSGRHLLTLINDVLDLSKIEAGQISIEREQIDPHAVLVDVISLLRVRAVEKNISLECEWQTPAPRRILSDGSRLRQLLVNLIGNAIKFTQRGGVRVIAAVDGAGVDATLRIEVVDSGIGIAPDKLESVFDPFVQADNTVTRRFGGTGLGLAISARIAEALEGGLSAVSVVGEGSRFTLRTPVGPLEGVEMSSHPVFESVCREAPVAEETPDRLDGLRVLVVEDGETNRRLIGMLLRRAGVEVEMAENGLEGYEAAVALPFDAILMDMQMPVMDGYTSARKLRDAGITTPIIALTAHAMKGAREKCLEAGCSGYLTKPIEAPRLFAMLAKHHTAIATVAVATEAPALGAAGAGPIASTLPTDDEEFREVVEQFLAKSGETLVAMRELIDNRDWEEFDRCVHWLKGSGGTAGYAAVSVIARDMEESLGEDPDQAAATRRLTELEELHSRLVVSLDAATVG